MWHRGTVLGGRYTLAERIGGGGMGEVWRADDTVLERQVAVKLLLPALLDDATFAERFRQEAKILAALDHPGIVDVHDYGECAIDGPDNTDTTRTTDVVADAAADDGEPGDPDADDDAEDEDGGASGARVAYIVMELVEGKPLSTIRAESGPMPVDRALGIVAQALDALQAAHERGIVHRDIKPSNLMVHGDDRVTLTDFGIARSTAATKVTASHVLGTALYMAPEQADSGPAVPASDLYSLGIVCYELLTGEPPFTGAAVLDVVLRHLREPAPQLPAEFSESVRAFVARSLAKKPEDRYSDAAVMAAAARYAASTEPSGGLAVTTGVRAPSAARVPALVRSSPVPTPSLVDDKTVDDAEPGRGKRRGTAIALISLGIVAGVVATVVIVNPTAGHSQAKDSGSGTSPAPGGGPPPGSLLQDAATSKGPDQNSLSPNESVSPRPSGSPSGSPSADASGKANPPQPGQAPAGVPPVNDAGAQPPGAPTQGVPAAADTGAPGTATTAPAAAPPAPAVPQGCGGAGWGAITNVGDGLAVGISGSSPAEGGPVIMGGNTAYGWVRETGEFTTIYACAPSGPELAQAAGLTSTRVELAAGFDATTWTVTAATTPGAFLVKDRSGRSCLTDNGPGQQLTVTTCTPGSGAQEWWLP